jgi:two-component SAPR family response regulator
MPEDVLLVEDDLIIALDVEETILRLGARTVRTASSVARALALIEERKPDFALLNISLGHETSLAIAERLTALEIPFGFLTGYGARATPLERFQDKPKLSKPYSTEALETLLRTRE